MKRKSSRQILIELLGSRCSKCQGTVGLEVDHIVPLAEGGKDEFSNMQALCKNCHKEKTQQQLNPLYPLRTVRYRETKRETKPRVPAAFLNRTPQDFEESHLLAWLSKGNGKWSLETIQKHHDLVCQNKVCSFRSNGVLAIHSLSKTGGRYIPVDARSV